MDRVDYESMTIQDLYNLYQRDELNLNPWYQRRSVWTDTQKSYLVNSIFENAPIPTCYIRHYLDVATEKSIKEVVDGQQRIRAVLSYIDDKFAASVESGEKKLKFSQLLPAERQRFRMQKMSMGYLINADDADVIDVFGRVNSVSKTLNDQEKRNATYSGAMKQFCLKQGAKYVTFWRATKVLTSSAISRMEEVQLVSDITFNLVNGLSDFSQPRLNKFYATNDENFLGITAVRKRFDAVMLQMMEHEAEITNSIFSRSPLFFSLFLVLDDKKVTSKKLKSGIAAMDAAFTEIHDGEQGKVSDVEFHGAVLSSTQRIRSREIRDAYIRAALA